LVFISREFINEETKKSMNKMSATTIYFIRHGSVDNPKNIFYGRLPSFGLSTEGRQQVRALNSFFREKSITRIISSPLLRARQTSREIAKFFQSIPISISSNLSEIKTPFDGLPLSELDARNWNIYSDTQAPFEQPIDVFNRSASFIRKTIREFPGKQIIAVTHADVIVFLLLWVHGYEVNYPNKSLIEHKKIDIPFPAPASVTTLIFQDEKKHPNFEYFNNGQG
jgi:broad specificity phosphatase PhoE